MNKTIGLILLVATALLFGCKATEQTNGMRKNKIGVIAHRGYWNTEGSIENSLSSLQNAIEGKFYGSEIDVHLTKDDILVVYHDNKIKGTDIAIQNTDYADIKNIILQNGEQFPLFEDQLKMITQQKGTKLIIEIKSHQTPERNQEAARKVYDMVKKYKAEKVSEYISFNMDACKELIRLDKKNRVAFLSGNAKNAPEPSALAKEGFWGIDYSYTVFKEHPEYVESAHKSGLTVNVWTVNTLTQMQEMIDLDVDFITTDEPVELKNLLNY